MKKNGYILLIIFVCCTFLCGCKAVTLDEEQEKLFIAYAVNSVLKYDYDYPDKLLEFESTELSTEPSTNQGEKQTTAEGETTSKQNDHTNQEATTAPGKEKTLNELMNIPDFSFTYKGYKVCKTYKSDDNSSVMTAANKKNLLVIELDVKNTFGQEKKLNMLEKSIKYTAIINDNKKTNPQIWANDITLNVYEGTFKANQTRSLVLVFQVDEGKEINQLRLQIENKDKDGYITLK